MSDNVEEMRFSCWEVEAKLMMLKKYGVKHYSEGADFSVEFFPPEGAAMPEVKNKKNELDVCVCGHPEHAHMNGFCVEGCDAEKCNPKQAETK